MILRPHQPDSFEQICIALHAAIGSIEAWEIALEVMARAFGSDRAMLVAAGQGQRDRTFYCAWNHSDEHARAYSDHWWQHDLWLQAGLERNQFQRGNICRGSDLVPAEVLRQSAYFIDYLSRLPAEHLLVCLLSDGRPPSTVPPMHLSFFRPTGAADFSGEDLEALRRLYPHIERAFDLHWRLAQLSDQTDLLYRLLDVFNFGVVLIDPARQIVFSNQAIPRLAQDSPAGHWLRELPSRVPDQACLSALIEASAQGDGGGASIGEGELRCFVMALPLAQPQQHSSLNVRASTLLIVADPAQESASAAHFVMQAFGLTPAESRLLPLLLRGETPGSMAQELHLSVRTVRTQLSAIFAKTGAARQQDLLRLMGRIPGFAL